VFGATPSKTGAVAVNSGISGKVKSGMSSSTSVGTSGRLMVGSAGSVTVSRVGVVGRPDTSMGAGCDGRTNEARLGVALDRAEQVVHRRADGDRGRQDDVGEGLDRRRRRERDVDIAERRDGGVRLPERVVGALVHGAEVALD
jgi:hypothetical protein